MYTPQHTPSTLPPLIGYLLHVALPEPDLQAEKIQPKPPKPPRATPGLALEARLINNFERCFFFHPLAAPGALVSANQPSSGTPRLACLPLHWLAWNSPQSEGTKHALVGRAPQPERAIRKLLKELDNRGSPVTVRSQINSVGHAIWLRMSSLDEMDTGLEKDLLRAIFWGFVWLSGLLFLLHGNGLVVQVSKYFLPVSMRVEVIVLCASQDSVREIMIKAHELNFDNGEYVFFNIDLFSR
ncbi:hypothetical protein RRG08_010850 [Elysia crispata]|uniref:Uncharacterized protein n=1 Tax=Elysia crispata TaxID=231223 RepID=A0AAE0XSH7_9GAST|nr:hypothetical protein RRG08_010850 [Elysia crispata]